jgi:hypothetical protein
MAEGAYNGNARGVIQTLVVLEQTRGAELARKSRAHAEPPHATPAGPPGGCKKARSGVSFFSRIIRR